MTDEDEVWTDPAPADTAAEEAVIGAMLLSAKAVADVAPVLAVEDFYRPAHQEIYATILGLFNRGDPVDAVTVAIELGPKLAPAGGAPYLHQVMNAVPSPSSAGYYARTVAEVAVARRLVVAGEHITQVGRSSMTADEMLADADRTLRAAAHSALGDTSKTIGEWFEPVVDDLQSAARGVDGIPSGYLDLDVELLRPFAPGQLIIVGARPSVGKSIVGLDLARHCAIRLRRPTGLISLEMTGPEITERLVAAEAGVPLTSLLRRDVHEDDWERIATASTRISGAPLIVDDRESHTLASIRAWVRRHRVDFLVIDYLQLITTPSTEARYRQNSVAELSRGLKLLAKSEGIPVVVLAQLNRQPETRSGGRPGLADLRESGAIEQDADVVLLLHRPELFAPEDRPGEVDVIVAKQRNGPTGTVVLTAQTAYARFSDNAKVPW